LAASVDLRRLCSKQADSCPAQPRSQNVLL